MVIHCIKCGIATLTKSKLDALDWEYEGFQWWMQFGIDKDILSQHKRAKGYYYKKIKYKDYPIIVPKQQIRYRKKNTKLTSHWIKISVRKRKGIGVWLPIKPHKSLPDFKYLKDSLFIKNHKYELRLIFDIPQQKYLPKNILAVDLGERVIATVCDSKGNKLFLGRNVRGIRRHYAWLRRNLGKKRLLKMIKRIGQKEKNKVGSILHKISKIIVELAKKERSLIVLGKLKGIRKKNWSKKLNRIIFNMPFYRLTQLIKYKAEQQGVQVKSMKEYYTSITCHCCGNVDKSQRHTQGLFKCSKCDLQYNADLNGALNILHRAREQDFLAGALAQAQESAAQVS